MFKGKICDKMTLFDFERDQGSRSEWVPFGEGQPEDCLLELFVCFGIHLYFSVWICMWIH